MEAMSLSQQVSHTVPQVPLRWTSTLPEQRSWPPVSRTDLISACRHGKHKLRLDQRERFTIGWYPWAKGLERHQHRMWASYPRCVGFTLLQWRWSFCPDIIYRLWAPPPGRISNLSFHAEFSFFFVYMNVSLIICYFGFLCMLKWNHLNTPPQHPPCVRSRTRPARPDRPTGSPQPRCSSARPGTRLLCPGGRSRPGPSHWGRSRSWAVGRPRLRPAGPTGRHTPSPSRRVSRPPPVRYSGLCPRTAAQPGGLGREEPWEEQYG